jgi:hypothetical protein
MLQSWIPKAKTEPIAQSAVDLMKLAKVTVDEFFEIPVGARDEMVQELADGLGALIQDYTSFVASCGMIIICHSLCLSSQLPCVTLTSYFSI